MKIAFISDLHLSKDTSKANQIFFALLKKWQYDLDALYILGDFFEYWLGDDDANEFIESIKMSLQEFTKHTPIFFIAGNHDFAVGKKFAKETGIQILKDLTVITHNTKKILLCHGDVFCTLDHNYQRMKKILQNPIIKFILRKLPLSWRYKLKNYLEEKSSNKTLFNHNTQHIYNVVDDTVKVYAKKYMVNTIIHGHTHQPNHYIIQSENNITINRYEIPDWTHDKNGGFILLNDDSIQIYYND